MMRRFSLITLLIAVGCSTGSSTEPTACTKEYVYGLHAQIKDARSDSAIAQGTILTLQEGSYQEVVTESWGGLMMFGAGERPGEYTVTAERLGYDEWTMSGVEILSDGCHVIPVSLRVQMAPAS